MRWSIGLALLLASCGSGVSSRPGSLTCRDGSKNGNETDLDCGGGTCLPCLNGQACLAPGDCQSGSCVGHACSSPAAQCLDNTKNGSETDVDCGGGSCPACANGRSCVGPTDCQSGSCT